VSFYVFFVKVLFVFSLFCVSLDRFVFVFSRLVVFGLVSSVPSQEIGWEERL